MTYKSDIIGCGSLVCFQGNRLFISQGYIYRIWPCCMFHKVFFQKGNVHCSFPKLGTGCCCLNIQTVMAWWNNFCILSTFRSKGKGKIEGINAQKNTLYGRKAVIIAAGWWTGSLMCKLLQDSDIVVHVPIQPRKVRIGCD